MPAAAALEPRLINRRLRGTPQAIASTVLNVCITSPITSGIVTALFTDPDDFADVYITALSTTMPMTMLASFLFVGPAVKLVFHNRIKPATGLRALQAMEKCAPALARLLGM